MYYFSLLSVADIAVIKNATSKYKYPPGPKGLPIIGVAHMLPPAYPGETTRKWAQEYGEMMTLQLGGTKWVFLNSSRVTKEILEKRSGVHIFEKLWLIFRLLALVRHGHLSTTSFLMGTGT